MFFIYLFKREKNNIDYIRFGKDHKPSTLNFGLIIKTLGSFVKNKRFYSAYELMEDNISKKLYLQLLLFRLLGSGHVKLPLNTEQFWKEYETIDKRFYKSPGDTSIGRFSLNNYEIVNNGTNIKLLAHPLSILNTFILKQYGFSRNRVAIGVQEGDIVIDAGACWGDTAVYFAQSAGECGRVFSFEFENKNLDVFKKNLSFNPQYAKSVIIKELALWDSSNEELSFDEGGPGTSLVDQSRKKQKKVITVSIDDLVKNENLAKVDFIKMDIEGAEGRVLKGALETIKKFKPKLAVSIYHSLKDFSNLPLYLDDLNRRYDLGYKFYLDHFTIYSEETVLFGISDKRNG